MEGGLRSTGEAAEEKVDTQEIMASSSSLVAGIEMDTELRGVSSSLVVEIQEEKMLEHSGGANEELMDGSELALRAEKKSNCSSWVVEMRSCLRTPGHPWRWRGGSSAPSIGCRSLSRR
ncbi:hypothetical protein PVAP13_8KG118602 [Panicum virgatum]|uniref:Uncharacterized protein n=1 Tax=Panicum virgatum TaxID=38727 RepID=A0A8T0PQB3_PANVG|nr:hypothetical protein PVAP13_8KG118602 [Panicum virgatum]